MRISSARALAALQQGAAAMQLRVGAAASIAVPPRSWGVSAGGWRGLPGSGEPGRALGRVVASRGVHSTAARSSASWVSQFVPMVRKAFSWDLSVASERVWFSFKDEGAAELLASFRTAADSDFGGQSHCTLELTGDGTALFSGELSLALADRDAGRPPSGDVDAEGEAGPTVKQRLAKWFAGERPRTAKVGRPA